MDWPGSGNGAGAAGAGGWLPGSRTGADCTGPTPLEKADREPIDNMAPMMGPRG